MREVITDLDQARRQVYIEAVIIDLSVARENQLGIALHGLGTADQALGAGSFVFSGFQPLKSAASPAQLAQGGDGSLNGFVFGARSANVPGSENAIGMSIPALGLLINAVATNTDADILSTPNVTATDNVEAVIKVQLNKSLQPNAPSLALAGAGSTGTGTGAGGLPLFSAPAINNYQPIGTSITIKPHLNESDEVRLEIKEEISDIAGPPEGTLGAIPFLTRSANTTLTVRDGQTAMIGGLVRNKTTKTERKVPLLGDIPLLGALFRSSSDSVEKSDLVLMLTPYIIRDPADIDRIRERKAQEAQEFRDHNMVFDDEARYEAPKDFTRMHGMLADIHQGFRNVAAQRELDVMRMHKDPGPHERQEPLPLPVPMGGHGSSGSGTTAAPGQSATGSSAQPSTLNLAPTQRSVERIEK
jgi:general secretion pathway protein D